MSEVKILEAFAQLKADMKECKKLVKRYKKEFTPIIQHTKDDSEIFFKKFITNNQNKYVYINGYEVSEPVREKPKSDTVIIR